MNLNIFEKYSNWDWIIGRKICDHQGWKRQQMQIFQTKDENGISISVTQHVNHAKGQADLLPLWFPSSHSGSSNFSWRSSIRPWANCCDYKYFRTKTGSVSHKYSTFLIHFWHYYFRENIWTSVRFNHIGPNAYKFGRKTQLT